MPAEWAEADGGKGPFVYACFCTAYKIERELCDAWLRILKHVPHSNLWLMPESARVKQNLIHAAQSAGVDHRRLVFLEKLEKHAHLKRLARVDLALDTRTVNGAATTSDALWAGVPVLTFKGRHFASRMSESLLTAVGLEKLVTSGIDAYEEMAVKLSKDAVALKAIKADLLENRKTWPLFDTAGYLVALENAYETMWLRYATHAPADMIKVKGA
jgi:protein O-GlcNAc transferase